LLNAPPIINRHSLKEKFLPRKKLKRILIALLYKVNYACNKDYISPSCTSIPQGWNRGTKKEVTPNKLKNLTFRKDKKTKKPSQRDNEINQTFRKDFDPRKPQDRRLTNERVSEFLNSIKEHVPSACVLYSIEHAKYDGLPPPLLQAAVEFISSEEIKGKPVEEAVPLFISNSQMTSEQVVKIERETRDQHSSDAWRKQRIGRITASNFHKVYTKTETIMKTRKNSKKNPQYSPVVSDIVHESEDISHLPQIKWGVEHEHDGVNCFMADIASQHEGGLEGFRKCGLYVKADYPYLAGSPDGLFVCKCCSPATLEIKCPYSARNGNIMEKAVYKNVEFLEDHNGIPQLKRTHRYYTQVQAQMWLCGVQHAFFVVWTMGGRPLYEEIKFDLAFITKVVNSLTLFYKAYILPCILGYKEILQCPKCEKVILEKEEINCVLTESSVCCEVCATWWHLPCAGLQDNSLESWLCFSCIVDNADSHDDASSCSDGESTGGELSGPSTSADKATDAVCSVCHLKDIPVGGEHVCSVCKNVVHAWCSNHEDITSSADLVCSICL
jgi:hypothetical protein